MRFLYNGMILAVLGSILLSCASGPPPVEPEREAPSAELPVYVLLVKEKSNPYMLKMYDGFVMACEEIGAVPVFKGPDSYTAQAQIEIIDELVAAGDADAIAIAANDANQLEATLQKAMDAGIKVLSLDSAVNPGSRMVHIQQADPEKIGRVLIQATYKMIGGSGEVGLISATEYATNQNLWIQWMEKELDENPAKYKDFHLLSVLYGDDMSEKSAQAATELLREHSELKAIITPSVVGMLAVGKTLKQQQSDVVFTGLGLPSEMAAFIEDGSCPWMYLWNPIDIGYLAAWSADALNAGDITGAEGDTFVAGRIGQRVVMPSTDGGTEILLGDPVKFDSQNIGEWKLIY